MARKSAQPTSDKECINVSMGAPLRFQSRLRSSYIYGHSVRQKGLSGAYGLRLGKQNDSRYPRNALSRTAHKSTEWVRKI